MAHLLSRTIEYQLFGGTHQKPLKLAVYVSGGSDSIALLHYLHSIHSKYEIQLVVQHFNFMLRGNESDQDELLVKNFCQKLDIKCHVHRLEKKFDPGPSNKSPQEWARNIRLDVAKKWQEQGYKVSTAHHRDDLAENFLIRLSRGASPEKILGMNTDQGMFIKPWL